MPRERLQTAEALAAPLTIEERVDRHGDLGVEIERLEALIENARVKKMREQISECRNAQAALREDILKEATANLADQTGIVIHGARFFVQIGKCAMSRTITDMKRLAELVGLDNFFDLATFPLSSVDDYLNPKEREQVLEVDHEGRRSFKTKSR